VPSRSIRTKGALAAVIATLTPIAAAAPAEAQSPVRIKLRSLPSEIRATIVGDPSCVNGRVISLFRVQNPGPPFSLGTRRAASPTSGSRVARATWQLAPGYGAGQYFARATAVGSCRYSTSRPITRR
jgi:hypothetical protein